MICSSSGRRIKYKQHRRHPAVATGVNGIFLVERFVIGVLRRDALHAKVFHDMVVELLVAIFIPAWIMPWIWCVLPSRTRLATAVLNPKLQSRHASLFCRAFESDVCGTISFKASDNVDEFCFAGPPENVNDTDRRSLPRSVYAACRKPMARCGGGDGQFDGSRPRISPTSIMSGSSRKAPCTRRHRFRVYAQFAMVHKAVFVLVNKFYRIFNRDDVVFAVAVGVVHNGGQCGGFAGAVGPVTTTSPRCSIPN